MSAISEITITDSEESYRAAIAALISGVDAWQRSVEQDEEYEYGDDSLRYDAYALARQISDGLRNDGHRFRVKLDMTEVARNTLMRFAEAVESHEKLAYAYESSPNHSRYEADEELGRDVRLAKRFLEHADDPEYRKSFTHEDNPLKVIEATPVPVPDPDGPTADGIRQGTRLRSRSHPEEVRTLLTGPYKDRSLGMVVRVSDERDAEVPQPGDNTVWGGYIILASQLRMLFEPVEA